MYNPDTPPFEVGSIVSIRGCGIDAYRFRKRERNPIVYGVVEEITLFDDTGWGDTNILVVVSGQYNWLDKIKIIVM